MPDRPSCLEKVDSAGPAMSQQKIDLPSRAEGHINGMRRLSQALSSQDGVLVSFAYPAHFYSLAHKRNQLFALQNHPMLRVEVIHDGLHLNKEQTLTHDVWFASAAVFQNFVKLLLHNLLHPTKPSSALNLRPPCCNISNTFCPWMQALADIVALPRIEYWTSTTAVFSMGTHLLSLVSSSILPLPKPIGFWLSRMAASSSSHMPHGGALQSGNVGSHQGSQEAASTGVKFLSLPECFSFIGSKEGEALSIAEPLDGPILQKYRDLAREAGMWLSLGGFQEKCADGSRLFNSHVLLDDGGVIQSCYKKIHLFDVIVPGGPVLTESKFTAPGSEVVVAESPVGRLGLSVCYDLRFPEFYQQLRFKKDAEVLLVPSAFTKVTGAAHWEILLRARAVETQCYVIAAAQTGKHNEKRESYGDAMIVDPWGTVISRCSDRLATGLAVAEVDLDFLNSVRTRMPISEHRRYDIYGCVDSAISKGGISHEVTSSL